MRQSEFFMPTLKEIPAEAEVISHKLMLRAGLVRKVAAGVYTFLPIGNRVLRKIENIVREEMDRFGAQEILMPAIQPRELWEKSGRWQAYGPEMMRLKDRKGRDFALGPTHEELITEIVKNEVRSYKDLPLNLYQIQPKFRDEPRPRFGVIRAREFIMKDAYSFDVDEKGLAISYEKMRKAYVNICKRCGLDYKIVSATTGLIGGKTSEEFMALADIGEDSIFYCDKCDYAANRELAGSKRHYHWEDREQELEKVHTPGKMTVEEVASFLNVPHYKLAKTLIYRTDKGFLAAVVSGDREAIDAKIAEASGVSQIQLLNPEEFDRLSIPFGYVGPKGLKERLKEITIILDSRLADASDLVIGGNEKDYHLKGVSVKRDLDYDLVYDIAESLPGDLCPKCEHPLTQAQAIEVGHIFQLGTKYSESMKAFFSDEKGELKTFYMGCYGVGVSRIIAAVIEQYSDEKGIKWPLSLAPFEVHIILLLTDSEEVLEAAEELYRNLSASGYETLFDDRDETPGVKFADADLAGIPVHVILGKKFRDTGNVEVRWRLTGKKHEISLKEVTNFVKEIRNKEMGRLSPEYLS